ncbi:hypothetical protein E2C01_090163 [Portunus trituberculatus]|uniref:Uncharacterized protein n=1 Tax=Portunus trituberculatus TaxID=210409 RepID=A0A5B7JAR5_PORTR|nr:hypothetical protein [Portunus trituberculatus]
MLTVLLILLTSCLLSSCSLPAQGFLFIPILSNPLMQELSFLNHSNLSLLWNSLPASAFPSSYEFTSFNREVSRYLSLALV